jgi:hypothetical protein
VYYRKIDLARQQVKTYCLFNLFVSYMSAGMTERIIGRNIYNSRELDIVINEDLC